MADIEVLLMATWIARMDDEPLKCELLYTSIRQTITKISSISEIFSENLGNLGQEKVVPKKYSI